MTHTEVSPAEATTSPAGGLVTVADLGADEVAWFGDEDIRVAVDDEGRPVTVDETERVISRWIAEQSSPGMFEVIGTLANLEQGTVATGARHNWLLLTDSHLRGSVHWRKSQLWTTDGIIDIPFGSVFAFAIPLMEIEVLDGNKHDFALATSLDGMRATWIRAVDEQWTRVRSNNPWHRDNTAFAQAVLAATIAVKDAHSETAVRESARRARDVDDGRAFASRKRSTVEFAAPK